jgi:hypothetical protein
MLIFTPPVRMLSPPKSGAALLPFAGKLVPRHASAQRLAGARLSRWASKSFVSVHEWLHLCALAF